MEKENLGLFILGSSLGRMIIYYIYTELCTFFNKRIYVDIWVLISRFGLEKEIKWKNRDKGLQNASFYFLLRRATMDRVFPYDPLVWRVTGIFLVLIPVWLNKMKGIKKGWDEDAGPLASPSASFPAFFAKSVFGQRQESRSLQDQKSEPCEQEGNSRKTKVNPPN